MPRRCSRRPTRCAWINGEPGFINGDALEDHRTGSAWDKPVHEDGRDFRSSRYQVDEAAGLLAEMSRRAARRASRSPPIRAAKSRCTSPADIA